MKSLSIAFFFLLSTVNCFSQTSTQELTFNGQARFYFFKDHQDHPYVELHMLWDHATITPTLLPNAKQTGTLLVSIQFLIEDSVCIHDRYLLSSTPDEVMKDFYDSRRYYLKPGNYAVQIQAVDTAATNHQWNYKTQLHIQEPNTKTAFSDILLIKSSSISKEPNRFTRNGKDLEPNVLNYVGPSAKSIQAYVEVYLSQKYSDSIYVFKYQLKQITGNPGYLPIEKILRRKARNPDPILISFDPALIPSGRYQLTCEFINRDKITEARVSSVFDRNSKNNDTFVQGSNQSPTDTYLDTCSKDELRFILKALSQVVASIQVGTIDILLTEGNPSAMRQYLYSWFYQMQPLGPKEAFQAFNALAMKADDEFRSGFGYGFETDRGRIYLKYGIPSEIISKEDEPSAPPYEIWKYDQISTLHQNNVKFLFYNPTLGHNDFKLLHSTARSEIQNNQWVKELYRSVPGEISEGIDGPTVNWNVNRHAVEYFNE